jgi:putative ABC transport system permease protein
MRVFLSAVGIAIGIAAMVAVLGISASGQEHLDRRLDALGTNLLRVSVSTTPDDPASHLPDDALGRIRRIGPVTATSATATLERTSIYRNDLVPKERSGGISVAAAQLDLPTTLRAQMASGAWLNEATARYPAVVLGDKAAKWLGVGYAAPGQLVYLGGQSFAVVGSSSLSRSPRNLTCPRSSAGRWPRNCSVSAALPEPSMYVHTTMR